MYIKLQGITRVLISQEHCVYMYIHVCTCLSLTELNLVDILYQMLRDKDPQVVSNCISVLDEVLAKEGGMVLNAKIAHYLLNRYMYKCTCTTYTLVKCLAL